MGTTLLSVPANLGLVLDTLEQCSVLHPTHQGLSERESVPYDRQALLAFAGQRAGQPLPQTLVHLRRRPSPAYDATISLSHRPQLRFTFRPETLGPHRSDLFAGADALAAAFRPDWGSAHLWHLGRPEDRLGTAWETDDERDTELLFRSSSLAPKDYYRQGPRGLTMRTWIGPHYVRQLGDQRVRTTPVEVAPSAWGGYRLDLVPEPWAAEAPVLLSAWRRGMAHLQEAGVLAQPLLRAGRVVDWARGPACTVGGSADPPPA